MKHIGGVDISLTSTGVGIITQRVDGSCIANATVITSKGAAKPTLVQRSQRLITLRNEIIYAVKTCDLVVVEGASFASKSAHTLDIYGLWWSTVGRLIDLAIPLAVCPPTTLKKLITGAGNSGKGSMCTAITKLYPSVQLIPAKRQDEDQADGLALAHAGAVWKQWAVPTLQRHRDSLGAIAWPDSMIDTESILEAV